MLFSSGANEPVWDGGGSGHSVFAKALLQGLDETDYSRFTFYDVFPRVQEVTAGSSEQVPQLNIIKNSGHEGGALVLEKVAH